jgi:hypothetical protein
MHFEVKDVRNIASDIFANSDYEQCLKSAAVQPVRAWPKASELSARSTEQSSEKHSTKEKRNCDVVSY